MRTTGTAKGPGRNALLRIRHFVQKHDKRLALLGALIVFTMYVVKDTKRERVKNLSDAISSAETAFVVGGVVEEARTSLAGARDDIQFLTNIFLQQHRKRPYWNYGKELRDIDMLEMRIRDANATIFAGMRLAEWIEDRDAGKQLSNLLQQSSPLLSRADALLDIATRRDFQIEQFKECLEIGTTAVHIQAEAGHIKIDLFERAERKRKAAENEYQFYTQLSHLLYFVGWGIALVAHFFGVKTVSAVD